MKKMLLVEDNGALRQILRLTFGNGEFELFEAENGVQALEIAEKQKPDFIFLDIMMPGSDGFDVCKSIRANIHMKNSTIIILSALGQKKDIEKGYEMGADLYIHKPFMPSELIRIVKEYSETKGLNN